MGKILTAFSAKRDGFRFVNYFQYDFPIQYKLPFVGNLDLNDVVFGLCGGMCAGALDYFHSTARIPEYDRPEAIDKKLFTFLVQRQLDSLTVPVLLSIIEWMMIEDDDLNQRMLRSEIPKIRRRIDNGSPAILCLIRVKGLTNPTSNHQVVATGYEISPDGRQMEIFLYDPNHPREEPSIHVGLTRKDFAISQSTGEDIRGFFLMPYISQTAVPKPPAAGAISFAAPDGFQLTWPVDSRVCTQHFNENPDRYSGFGLPGHEGLDLLAMDGARIYACADGEVFEAGPREGHPYGIQIRIKHMHNGQEYHTVYAHLREVTVRMGDMVSAGQQIGRADSTGNSTGPHLHLTLKKIGARTGKYPPDIIDPWPYLQAAVVPPDRPPSSPSGITVYTNAQVNLRDAPDINGQLITSLPVAEGLAVLGKAESEQPKIGKDGQWLEVQTASGQVGYVAAWLVVDTKNEAFPPSGIVVYPIEQVNLRSGPATSFPLLGNFTGTEPLSVLGDAEIAKSRIGQEDQWLQVLAQNGQRGFVAAWLVKQAGQVSPKSGLVVYPTDFVNLRAQPTATANILAVISPDDSLAVLGEIETAEKKIGQQDQWLNVQTNNRLTGYVAAWYVQKSPARSAGYTGLPVFPIKGVKLRTQAADHAPAAASARRGERLFVMAEDLREARKKIGASGQWIYVRKKSGKRGWVDAAQLSKDPLD